MARTVLISLAALAGLGVVAPGGERIVDGARASANMLRATHIQFPEAPTSPITPHYKEYPSVASNFDVAAEMHDARIPASSAPDPGGAFRFICTAGQILADDPVVFPGQPGRSHLHQFFGNTSANAHSTYGSLRSTGDSTCMSRVNRSAYWMPAMLDGKGHVVRPDYISIYYKRFPDTSPLCTQRAKACVRVPRGLRFIMGRDIFKLDRPPTGNFHFTCETKPGSYVSFADALANCVVGKHLVAVIDAPMCWDGKRADSPDHQSHLSYQFDTRRGYSSCPAAHPYRIPTFTLSASYRILPGDDLARWSFASDAMAPGAPRGSTLHADWFGAWDDGVMATWTEHCINKRLDCSDGILGNGKKMNRHPDFTWEANPRLVAVPAHAAHN